MRSYFTNSKNIIKSKQLIISITVSVLILMLCFLPVNPAQAENISESSADYNFANLVVYAYFSDDVSGDEFFQENASKLEQIYNGDSKRSVSNYLNAISYGKLKVCNILPKYNNSKVVTVKLPYSMSTAYSSNIDGEIIRYIVNCCPDLDDELDYDKDGYIDNFSVILHGGSNDVPSGKTYVSHKSDYGYEGSINGKKIGAYNFLNTYTMLEDSLPAESGVICHEFLHTLGFPDLYNAEGTIPGPVYIWDIMATANYGMPWPLAYMRKSITGWVDIDGVTADAHLVLDEQKNSTGKVAYILKSPLNEQEFFVVEFRKKATKLYETDRSIGTSGLIVYRINTAVEGLSNHYGQTGVYVFRPATGYNGYSELQCGYYAALSLESGRTSIGSSDMCATLEEGALTFSDGSNSGIVIKNVSSSEGTQMSFDVEFPEISSQLWTDDAFVDEKDSAYKKVSLVVNNGVPYLAALINDKLSLYFYSAPKWTSIMSHDGLAGTIDVQVISCENDLYLAYSNYGKIKVERINSITYETEAVSEINNCNGDFSIRSIDGRIYIAYVDMDYKAHLSYISEQKVIDMGIFYQKLCGQPQIVNYKEKLFVSVRDAAGVVKLYSVSDSFINEFEIEAGVYDLAANDEKLYLLSRASGDYELSTFDGREWSTEIIDKEGYSTDIIEADGVLYLMLSDATELGRTRVFYRSGEEGTLTQLGTDIDGVNNEQDMIMLGGEIIVAYCRNADGRICVKRHEIAEGENGILNRKLEKLAEYLADYDYDTDTPPEAIKVGDEMDLDGNGKFDLKDLLFGKRRLLKKLNTIDELSD